MKTAGRWGPIEAVVFDIGGVVADSPFPAVARYERELGLPPDAINRAVVVAGEQGAWARLERGELTVEAFCAPFEAECRARGLRVGALTNNWVTDGGDDLGHPLRDHFDVFVESRVLGIRKPDPRMYEIVCRELRVAPPRAAFLDDIGRNLKPARALGMRTIKVDDPDQALRELGGLLGVDLLG